MLKTTDAGETWRQANAGLLSLYVSSIAVDPSHTSIVYAGTGAGVAKSTRGGASWTGILAAAFVEAVNALAVAPSESNTIYAGITAKGVYKTTDGGITWLPANQGIAEEGVTALAVHPTDPLTAFAGVGNLDLLLEKTTDGGVTWVTANKGLPALPVLTLTIDPSAPDTIYAGTESFGVYKSTDAGDTWAYSSSGIDSGLWVYSIAIDVSNSKTLYAGTQRSGGGGGDGVFKSTDGGATWTRMSEGIGPPPKFDSSVYALAINPSEPATIYAASACDELSEECHQTEIYKSADGAATWTSVLDINYQPLRLSSVVIDPSNPLTVWAGHNGELGVYRTADGGVTWAQVNDGLTDLFIYALAIQSTAPFTVYAGTGSGVFKFEK